MKDKKTRAPRKHTEPKLYLVWVIDDAEDPDSGYWSINDSLEDAVTGAEEVDDDGLTEVYEAQPILLGKYKSVAKMVRIKKK